MFYHKDRYYPQRKGNSMFQLKRILISGLVALLMVGMVTAGEVSVLDAGGEEVERSYIGSGGNIICEDTNAWECVHFEFWINFRIPWA